MRVFLITVVFALLVVTACGSREVTRTDTDTVTDLSGYWNDTDARIVADSIVDQCLTGRWFDTRAGREDGGRSSSTPVIVVGGVRNQSTEHINVDVFMSEIERSLLNSGRFQIAAGGRERDEVRGERRDQSIFASPSTAAEFGREVGADYVMTGTVNSIEDQEDDTRVIFYQVNIELIDVETALKVWMGSTEIKKVIEW
ncbi:MAG: penicillin-binding protein activator LpoB [Candidatus Sabulitectum sp.]|nr:penicillin-binding protein activator LpoB [Candidatus Sabulitectum sp.]